MTSFVKASRYGNSVPEMSVCQRLTPDRKTVKAVRDVRDSIWTVLVCAFYALRWMSRALVSTSLFWAWCMGYSAIVLASVYTSWFGVPTINVADTILGCMTVATYIAVPILVFGNGLIVLAALVAVYTMYRKYRFQQRLFKLYLRQPYLFESQTGEKDLRRDKYFRNV